MFNIAKVELEFIPNSYMFIFLEKGMRSGVSYISNRYSKASNKYLKSCDPKQKWKQIIYLYVNNLRGYAMSKFLLISGFKWIDPKEFGLTKCSSSSSKRCVLKGCVSKIIMQATQWLCFSPRENTNQKRNVV